MFLILCLTPSAPDFGMNEAQYGAPTVNNYGRTVIDRDVWFILQCRGHHSVVSHIF